MALKKSITTSSGAVASYWNILSIFSHRGEKFVEVVLSGYVDEDKRRAVKADGSPQFRPLDNGVTRVTGEGYDALTKNGLNPSYDEVYAFLATQPAWADAESDVPAPVATPLAEVVPLQ